MKIIGALLLMSIPFIGYSQKELRKPSSDLKTILVQTRYVMNQLSIPIREYVDRDSPLIVTVDPEGFALNSQLRTHKIVFHYKHLSRRYYIDPKIEVSPLIDSIINKKKDTTEITKLKALSNIVHEVAHYLQVTDSEEYIDASVLTGTPSDKEQEKAYVAQPVEFEAWAVGAYYFLYFHKKKTLKKIMASKEDNNTKMKRLINAYREIIYPWRVKVFDI